MRACVGECVCESVRESARGRWGNFKEMLMCTIIQYVIANAKGLCINFF